MVLYGATMVAMTAVAFFLVTKLVGQGAAPSPMGQASKAGRQADSVDDNNKGTYGGNVTGPEHDLGELIVNPRGTAGTRYLKLHIIAVLSSSSVGKKIESRNTQITHKLISTISSKTVDEIDSPEGIDTLQKDIVKGLNSILGEDKVRQVYFTDFVIQ